jgi:hypothetical protein
MIFSKVVDGVVESVVNVEDLQWIIDNPERYGDAELYIETDPLNWEIVWGRVGYNYDYETGLFSDPFAPLPEESEGV